jgi:hypothetical protein
MIGTTLWRMFRHMIFRETPIFKGFRHTLHNRHTRSACPQVSAWAAAMLEFPKARAPRWVWHN